MLVQTNVPSTSASFRPIPTQLLSAGIPLATVAERLGDTQQQILESYSYALSHHQDEATDIMARKLFGDSAQTELHKRRTTDPVGEIGRTSATAPNSPDTLEI